MLYEGNFNKVDIHVHTTYSYGSSLRLKDVEKFLNKNPDFGLAVTDINTIEGALILNRKYPDRIIVGSQIITKQGAVTGLFLKEPIPGGRELNWTIDAILVQDGLVMIPHPFDRTRKTRLSQSNLNQALKRCDLVEIFNSRTIHAEDNKKAVSLIGSSILPVCGSDAHTKGELGRTYIKLASRPGMTSSEFYDALIQSDLICRKATAAALVKTKLYSTFSRITKSR